jgi:hypothetical protein
MPDSPKLTQTPEGPDPSVHACVLIGATLILNMLRLEHAGRCFAEASSFLPAIRGIDPAAIDGLKFDVDGLTGKDRHQFALSSFRYVTLVGYLVYATTVFDSFLSDLTRLLLTCNPAVLGENCKVSIGVLASPEARTAVINKEISRKIRSLSYASFEERLDYIVRNFNVTLGAGPDLLENLRHYSELRNTAVHDQAIFGINFDDKQGVRLEGRQDPLKPTSVASEDVTQAVNTYLNAGVLTYQAVLRDVFKAAAPEMKFEEFAVAKLNRRSNQPGRETPGKPAA